MVDQQAKTLRTALPATGTFEWAMMRVREGHTLRRRSWYSSAYLTASETGEMEVRWETSDDVRRGTPVIGLNQNDWEVVA